MLYLVCPILDIEENVYGKPFATFALPVVGNTFTSIYRVCTRMRHAEVFTCAFGLSAPTNGISFSRETPKVKGKHKTTPGTTHYCGIYGSSSIVYKCDMKVRVPVILEAYCIYIPPGLEVTPSAAGGSFATSTIFLYMRRPNAPWTPSALPRIGSLRACNRGSIPQLII